MDHSFHIFCPNYFNLLIHAPRILLREVPHQTGDVPRPLAEWREFDGKDAESVIEIATKSAVLGHPSQVPIGRGHQSKVHANSPRAAKSLEFLLL